MSSPASPLDPLTVMEPSDLDARAVAQVAAGRDVVLDEQLLAGLARRRAEVLDALAGGSVAYGVTTGMGALGEVALDEGSRADHSARLMLARSTGGPPYLDAAETRALLAVRLRTLLDGDAGVSPGLCEHVVGLLRDEALPAVPRHGSGAAGEILPLAHTFSHLAGAGRWLTHAPREEPPALGPKEGVALLQGTPVAAGLAVLRGDEAAALDALWLKVVAAEVALVGASRDPYRPALARADAEQAGVLDELATVLPPGGEQDGPRRLQAPVSFRVVGPAHAHLRRRLAALRASVVRALDGVSDSPAWLPDEQVFVGTAGFHGIDLAADADAVRVALAHLASLGAARLHRMLDPEVTGLPAQLSGDPGPHAGLVAVHKRAVAAVHAVSGWSPTPLSPSETSGGQEDVQTFALEAAERLRLTLGAARQVLACELLAVHQARLLAPARTADAPPALAELLDLLAEVLPATTLDRPWGEDLQLLLEHPVLGGDRR